MKLLKINKTLIIVFVLVTTFYSCKKERPVETADLNTPELSSVIIPGDIKICTERTLEDDGITPRGAVIKTKKWTNGSTIKVSLNGTTSAIRSKVMKYAKAWETYANIKFTFVNDDNSATIRVGFVNGGGSWSYVGTDAKSISSSNATMNFGWFDSSTSDTEYSRVVIHEFGHALGMIHEHQHPLVSIPWDKPAVYAYYAKAPNNWTTAQTDNNIFKKYSTSETNYSSYDKASIMHYAVPNELTTGDFEIGWNTVLSSTDKSFIKTVYPF